MSNPAQEEADRLFSSKGRQTAHPEDQADNHSDKDLDEDDTSKPEDHSDPGTDDDDNVHKMATMTSSKTVFHLPATASYANTGPKGVIADAQSFARAKQMTFRQRLASIASNFAAKQQQQQASQKAARPAGKSSRDHSPESDLTMSEDEVDSEFMQTWRANRVQELSSLSNQQQMNTRRQSPSPRAWGTLQEVDANGYLDAIEKVSAETIVVVFINNPHSQQSNEVEDLLEMLAYKYATTRFIKLHYEIAEMEAVEIPAILAYKNAEVLTTISGANSEDLEDVFKHRHILS